MCRTFQLSAEHLCWYSTWMELVVNPTAFSLLSQITVLSSEFHEESPSAQTDPTRWLWDDTDDTLREEHTDRILLRSENFVLMVSLIFGWTWLHEPKPEL